MTEAIQYADYADNGDWIDPDDLDFMEDLEESANDFEETVELPPAWESMVYHREQQRYFHCLHRFCTVHAGRRSGKTALAKRRIVLAAWMGTEYDNARFFCGAPVFGQAKRLFWKDLKKLIPNWLKKDVSESALRIELYNGSEIWVLGLDKPERIEGDPWDGCVITEMGNIKETAWPEHIYPALMERAGWAVLEGVPEGRNHFFKLNQTARREMVKEGPLARWGSFHWRSEEILPLYGRAEEIEEAKQDMDPQTLEQELGGMFVSFKGRAYYQFQDSIHTQRLRYNPKLPLTFFFDFNVAPGVAAIGHMDMELPHGLRGTGIIDEVWIEQDSNTPAICKELVQRYGRTGLKHKGPIICHGDSTGGNRDSSQTEGTDWDIIKKVLDREFTDQVSYRYPRRNPSERSRVNAMNSRMRNSLGIVQFMVDAGCVHIIDDYEGVGTMPDGSIDKNKNKMLSHLSDAIGYGIAEEFPMSGGKGRRAGTSKEDFI